MEEFVILISAEEKLDRKNQEIGMIKVFTPEDILPDGDDHTTSVNPFTGFQGKARKGTVAATLNNIALLNKLLSNNENQEQIENIKKTVVGLMPSLKAIGIFDFFTPLEWISSEHLGRTYIALLYLHYYPNEINQEVLDKLKKMNLTTKNPFLQSELQSLVRNNENIS